MEVSKRLDLATGEGEEFLFKDDGNLLGKFVIDGTASANIKIFEVREPRSERCFYKASCSDWNGATATLYVKTTHPDDEFSSSAVVFSEDKGAYSEIR